MTCCRIQRRGCPWVKERSAILMTDLDGDVPRGTDDESPFLELETACMSYELTSLALLPNEGTSECVGCAVSLPDKDTPTKNVSSECEFVSRRTCRWSVIANQPDIDNRHLTGIVYVRNI